MRVHARSGTRGVRSYPRVVVHASRIHGRGAFADEDIAEGTVITRSDDDRAIVFNWGSDPEVPDSKFIKRGTPERNVLSPIEQDRRVGHVIPDAGWVAARDIKRGEELLV